MLHCDNTISNNNLTPSHHCEQESDDCEANPFHASIQTVSPQTAKRRKGLAQSVCQTFGLVNDALNSFVEVSV